MANDHLIGKLTDVAQVSTVQITGDDAATTYTITINGVEVSVAGTGTGVNDTAAALQVALAASTHVYFAAITWTVSTDTITGTGAVAGMPFTATASKSGGTGTIGSVAEVTAATGANHWAAGNFASGSLPSSSDVIRLRNINEPILHSLDQSAVTLTRLEIDLSSLGNIGLNPGTFQQSESGGSQEANEYRATYLAISATDLIVGDNAGSGQAATGAGRIKIDTGSNASAIRVVNTGAATDNNLPAAQFLANNAGSTFEVINGSAGLAAGAPGETSTVLSVTVRDGICVLGAGVTLTNLYQWGGLTYLSSAATLVEQFGGSLVVTGAGAITTLTIGGGTADHASDGNIATANVAYGATLKIQKAITITTLELSGKLDLSQGEGEVTITTCNGNDERLEVYDPNGRLADNFTITPRATVNLGKSKINLGVGAKLRKVA